MQIVVGMLHFLSLGVQDLLCSALLLLPLPVVQAVKTLVISRALSIRHPRLPQPEMSNKLVSALENCYFAFLSFWLLKAKEILSSAGCIFKKEGRDVQNVE